MKRIVAPVVLVSMAVLMLGCDGPKATFRGKELDAPSLMSAVQQAEDEAREKAAAEDRADKAEAKRVAAKAAADSIRATAKLDITAAEVKAELARIQAESGIAMQALAERAEARASDLAASIKSIGEQADAAFGAIEARERQRSAIVGFLANNPVVKSAAASVGIDTGGITGIMGTGAAAWALTAWRGRKSREEALAQGKAQRDELRKDLQAKAEAAWQEGYDLAHKERDRADAHYEEATTKTLLLASVPPAKPNP